MNRGTRARVSLRVAVLIAIATGAATVGVILIAAPRPVHRPCRCSGSDAARRVVQLVADEAGGLEAWESTTGIAWTTPDGSQFVYGSEKDAGQVVVEPLHFQTIGDRWEAYDHIGDEWTLKGLDRERRGGELRHKYYVGFLTAFLPFVMCRDDSTVSLIEPRGHETIVRLTGTWVSRAGFDACEVTIDPTGERIKSASFIGEKPRTIRFVRWERAFGIDVPVVEEGGEHHLHVEVFDHFPMERFILGR